MMKRVWISQWSLTRLFSKEILESKFFQRFLSQKMDEVGVDLGLWYWGVWLWDETLLFLPSISSFQSCLFIAELHTNRLFVRKINYSPLVSKSNFCSKPFMFDLNMNFQNISDIYQDALRVSAMYHHYWINLCLAKWAIRDRLSTTSVNSLRMKSQKNIINWKNTYSTKENYLLRIH